MIERLVDIEASHQESVDLCVVTSSHCKEWIEHAGGCPNWRIRLKPSESTLLWKYIRTSALKAYRMHRNRSQRSETDRLITAEQIRRWKNNAFLYLLVCLTLHLVSYMVFILLIITFLCLYSVESFPSVFLPLDCSNIQLIVSFCVFSHESVSKFICMSALFHLNFELWTVRSR